MYCRCRIPAIRKFRGTALLESHVIGKFKPRSTKFLKTPFPGRIVEITSRHKISVHSPRTCISKEKGKLIDRTLILVKDPAGSRVLNEHSGSAHKYRSGTARQHCVGANWEWFFGREGAKHYPLKSLPTRISSSKPFGSKWASTRIVPSLYVNS